MSGRHRAQVTCRHRFSVSLTGADGKATFARVGSTASAPRPAVASVTARQRSPVRITGARRLAGVGSCPGTATRWAVPARILPSGAGRGLDVVVAADRGEQPGGAAFVHTDSGLRRQVVAAPADPVVFQRAPPAGVGR